MTIQDLGSIGELIAAVATIATLGYLALQMRQNTATVRGASAASHAASNQVLNSLLAQDLEVNRILWTGLADPTKLDESETRRFDAVLHMVVDGVQQSWRFHHDGVIDDATWQGHSGALRWLISEPGFRPYWERYRAMQHPGFVRAVEQLVDEGSSEGDRRSGAAQQGAAADSA